MLQLLDNSNIVDICPLTKMQEGIYFHFLYDRNSPAFFVQVSYRIKGKIDTHLVRESLLRLHKRHEILRTAFNHEKTGRPLQIILKQGQVDFKALDFSHTSVSLPLERLTQFRNEDRQQFFDLNRDVLMRVTMIKLNVDVYEFVWSHHHILMDGWCTGILINEFNVIYQSLMAGTPPVLPAIKPFRSYVKWLEKSSEEKSIKFWKQYLAGYRGLATLPRYMETKTSGFDTHQHSIIINPKLTSQLKRISELCQVTLSTIIQALWGIVLCRYKGENDAVFGLVVSGRPSSLDGVEKMVGLFINTIPVRISFDDIPFSSLLIQVQQRNLAIEDHSYVSVADIQSDNKVDGKLFDHALVFEAFQENKGASGAVADHSFSSSQSSVFEQSNYDLDIRIGFGANQGMIMFRYNRNAFPDQLITDVGEFFENTIIQVTNDFHVSCFDLLKITPSELHKIKAYNDTSIVFPKAKTIVALLEEASLKWKDKVAIVEEIGSISYEDLWMNAGYVSELLRNSSPKNELIAGIFMDRGISMMESIIGVWKTGGSYLPLDPQHPLDRLKGIIQNSGMTCLITDKNNFHTANQLLWMCPGVGSLFCADSSNLFSIREPENESMKRELWEYVAKNSVDSITAGGWISSYTGLAFSEKEMQEYVDNAVTKVRKLLPANARVLEIGCASGLTMFALAPYVGHYVGIDLSDEIINRNRLVVKERGLTNIHLHHLYAHEIEYLTDSEFDVIILNSVVQNFHGLNYFRDILTKSMALLKESGHIFLGDLMDLDKKTLFEQSLHEYSRTNPSVTTKTDWTDELFISKDFLFDLCSHFSEIQKVSCSDKLFSSIANELTDFRFDAILTIDKASRLPMPVSKKRLLDRSNFTYGQMGIDRSTPEGLAYIIYTSGSTGVPKGAMVKHVGMLNHLYSKINTFHINDCSKVLQNARHTFDISVWQFFAALLEGGTTFIYRQERALSISSFIKNLYHDGITLAEVVPSYLDVLLDECAERSVSLPSLEFMLVTGETLPKELVKRWLAIFPTIPIANAYGPTEASDDITHHIMDAPPWTARVPLGSPIQNMQIWILDQFLQVCPPGVTGEICVAGVGVGKGYLNDFESTARTFITNPVDGSPANNKMYRTGDMGCWLPDGTIEFIGRKDQQVKIRGFRIEIEEIEIEIRKITGVKSAVVVDLLDENHQAFLMAYLTTVDGMTLTRDQFEQDLNKTLPEYMIPADFMQLDSLPLNANGKIDRKLLPQPGAKKNEVEDSRGLQSPTELKLAEVWKGLLPKPLIYSTDNFFRLGGHSLKATRLVSLIRKEFKVKIELRDVFEYPTLEKMAGLIDNAGISDEQEIPKLPLQDRYLASHAQKRMWILSQFPEASLAYNVFNSWIIQGEFDEDVFRKALTYLMERHEILRTTFVTDQSDLFQIIQDAKDLAVPVWTDDISDHSTTEDYINRLLNRLQEEHFDFEKGPLFQFYIIRTKPLEHYFILKMHHIICDGWSMQLLFNELNRVYISLSNGISPDLEPLRIQYKEFSAFQISLAENTTSQGHREYWHRVLNAPIEPLRLPVLSKRPEQQTFSGGSVVMTFSSGTYQNLMTLSNDHDCSLFMTLVALVDVLFYRYTGQQDIILGTSVAGRSRKELEHQIGFYVNTVALRNKVNGNQTFRSVLQQVKEMVLGAFQHQDYPFDLLVDELSMDRDLSRSAIFDVLVELQNYQHTISSFDTEERVNEGLRFLPYSNEKVRSIFDLNLEFREHDKSLYLTVNYNTDLYSKEQVTLLTQHLERLADSIYGGQNVPIERHDFLLPLEKQAILQASVSKTVTPQEGTISKTILSQALANPGQIAVRDKHEPVTYGTLMSMAAQVNELLSVHAGGDPLVGILMHQSAMLTSSMIGAWQSGKAFLLLDPEADIETNGSILSAAGIGMLLTSDRLVYKANDLQWSCLSLRAIASIDSENIYLAQEPLLESMNVELWNTVGERATDAIEGGGWIDSYSGKAFSENEMKEYAENAYTKLSPFLKPQSRVLEIGCASGLTMFRLSPQVGYYVGTDMSSSILKKNQKYIDEHQIKNISLRCVPAHEIDTLGECDFDIIVINSVIQNFSGVNYLRDVLNKCVSLCNMDGVIYVGDVMDIAKKRNLLSDIKRRRVINNLPEGPDFLQHKFYSEHFFADLPSNLRGVRAVERSEKKGVIENELTRYRYDVILHIDKNFAFDDARPQRFQFDKKDLISPGQIRLQASNDISNGSGLAYVSYEADWSGRWRGVMIRHDALMNQLHSRAKLIEQPQGICMLQHTHPSSHNSLWESFFSLFHGGMIAISDPQEDHASPPLVQSISDNGVHVARILSAELPSLLEALEGGDITLSRLRALFIEGELTYSTLFQKCFELLKHTKLINSYVASEAGGAVAHREVTTSTANATDIGLPVDNVGIYIMNESLQICPVGVEGEICITGRYLSAGYWKNGHETHHLPENPYGSGETLFRTGDSGRRLRDGRIEFCGTEGSRVSQYGRRFSLYDIENALLQVEGIKAAAVKANTAESKTSRLTAFVQPNSKLVSSLEPEVIQQKLESLLPHYMIPVFFETVDRFPLDRKGRLNRKLLPEITTTVIQETDWQAPKHWIEVKLASLWEEILNKKSVGKRDNFFVLGGHSLKATRLVLRIEKELHVKIPLSQVFQTPVLEDMAEVIKQASRVAFAPVVKTPDQASYPLSHAQKRLWVIDKLNPGMKAYNMPSSYLIMGEINLEILFKAFSLLIKKHEVLRTRFILVDGEPRQVIHDADQIEFKPHVYDLQNVDNARQKAIELCSQESNYQFDLSELTLVRMSVIRLEKNRNVIVLNIHHIISDGWSMEVMIKDIMIHYDELIKNKFWLPDILPLQYRDYTMWQQSRQLSGAAEADRSYWRNKFLGEIPVLDLPVDHKRPEIQDYRGQSHSFVLDQESTIKLKALANKQGVSLYILLTAVTQLLLHRYTRQNDIIVGTPVSGRDHAEFSDQIGLYVNTVVLRTPVNSSLSFVEFLSIVKEEVLETFEHQFYPFDVLVDELQLPRNLNMNPLFHVMITYWKQEAVERTRMQGMRLEPFIVPNQYSKLDLTFHLVESSKHIGVNIEYASALFSQQRIAGYEHHFKNLVNGILFSQSQSIGTLPFLSSYEITREVFELNKTGIPFPKTMLIHQLLDRQYVTRSASTAVWDRGENFSYGDLGLRVNQVAHCLKQKFDIATGDFVGIVMDKSVHSIVAILATLKIGAAYVAIDPTYPDERISYVISDASIKLIISEKKYGKIQFNSELPVLVMDDENFSGYPGFFSGVIMNPENIAYVIYTSGSTGKPKGVKVSHRNLIQLILNENFPYDFNENDRWVLFHSLSFDVSVWEIFGTFFTGGSLFIADSETLKTTDTFINFLVDQRITILNQVPSVFYQLIRAAQLRSVRPALNLRYILFAGEALTPSMLKWWKSNFPEAKTINMYGITETTIHVTYKEITTDEIERGESNIGLPMPNQGIYIVDDLLQIVPQGTFGEIAVFGEGVSKGYIHLDSLNGERFVNDPYREGNRIYLSGDFAKRSVSGDIIYIGRKDFQLKIRGFRIEASEVENGLVKAGASQSVVVALDEANTQGKYLAAYITGVRADDLDAYKSRLTQYLPDYMIPSAFVLIENIPFNANGKVDRKKLPLPSFVSQVDYLPPQGDIEERIAVIWQEELAIAQVGRDDNFFELGGHSLKAVRIISSVYKEFGTDLLLRDIFLNPTIRTLAELVGAHGTNTLFSLNPLPKQDHYAVSHAQKRIWVLSQFEQASTAYNMPYPVRIDGPLNEEVFRRALHVIIKRHESLRTSFDFVGDELRQFISPSGTARLEILDFRFADDPVQMGEDTCLAESKRTFDLKNGPLLSLLLIRLSDSRFTFMVNIHHIISDGWSMELFGNELFTLYNALIRGLPDPLPEIVIQYKEYSQWQREQLQGESLIKHERFWHNELQRPLPVLEIGGEKIRPNVLSYQGKTVVWNYEAQLTNETELFAISRGTTLFNVLLSAFKVLLYRYSGQDDIIVGMSSAGRLLKEFEGLIGFFVNPLPLRTKFQNETPFDKLLDSIKQKAMDAIDHQIYPFDRLVEDLVKEKNIGRSAIFDVLIGFQNFENSISVIGDFASMGDLSVSAYSVNNETSIFDLNVFFTRQGEKLTCNINYNTDIYEYTQVESICRHLGTLLTAIIRNPETPIGEINYLSDDEIIRLNSFNETSVWFPSETTVTNLIAKTTTRYPSSVAVIDEEKSITYQGLYQSSGAIANFFQEHEPSPILVGLLLDRSVAMSESILGIWRAGHAYVPLDTEGPFNRLLEIAGDARIAVLITSKKYLGWAYELQWLCPQLKTILCIDTDHLYQVEEPVKASMDREMWEEVGTRANNDIEAGGWINSFTGEPFSQLEMSEYSENVYNKLKPFLSSKTRVLEIGCSSGLTMFKLAPYVDYYLGTDMSATIIEKNHDLIKKNRLHNIEVACLAAQDIDRNHQSNFDVIIINSVIQNFNGLNYFRSILEKCLDKISSSGIIFVGDVMDLNQRSALVEELKTYRTNHPERAHKTIIDFPDNQFYAQDFFTDLKAYYPSIKEVVNSEKTGEIRNELTRFRFDSMIYIDKANPSQRPTEPSSGKNQYDTRSLTNTTPIDKSVPEALAYVIYTSGSTGKPKGAMICHDGMLNHIYSKITTLALDETSKVLQTASHTFDVSVWQFHAGLVVGGTTVVYSKELFLDPPSYIQRLCDDGISVAQAVPSHLNFLLDESTSSDNKPQHLKYFIVSGETLSASVARKWFSRFPDVSLINAYGPTEASDNVTQWVITEAPSEESVSLGKPLQNTKIYILDGQGNLCGVGVRGEICIAGIGVGPGYLFDPERTANAFVKNRFSDERYYSMLYKTGDIGCWDNAGRVSFFGRKDHQVKIRGLRIELSEIEVRIAKLDGIRSVVVTDQTGGDGEKFLVCYLIPLQGYSIESDFLRRQLMKELPEYMVPRHVIIMDEFPVTGSGKINRKALPSYLFLSKSDESNRPETNTQKTLATIWEDILDVKPIGLNSDFFELGGHSLKATRMVSRVLKEFQKKIKYKEVYENSTLLQLSELIDRTRHVSDDDIELAPVTVFYELSNAQKRLFFLSQQEEASIAYNLDWAYRFEGDLNIPALEASLHECITRHEILRTIFVDVGGEPKQKILPEDSELLLLEKIDLTSYENRSDLIYKLVNREVSAPFNLKTGPLIRSKLIRESPGVHYFLLTLHHIVADGWSLQILTKELLIAYERYNSGQERRKAPLRIQYKDFVHWQNKRMSGPGFQRLRSYWREKFKGELPVLDLPTFKIRPGIQTYRGDEVQFVFSSEVKESLYSLAKRNNASFFTSLVVILKTIFYKLTDQPDIIIGTSTSGRLHHELEDQLGFYLNTLALRTTFNGGDTFHSLFAGVKNTILEAYDHQEYPFDLLVEDLNLRKDLSRSPLFDVLVLLQNIELGKSDDGKNALGGIQINQVTTTTTASSNDLLFDFAEAGNQLRVKVVFNTDLYDRSYVQHLIDLFPHVLNQVVSDPQIIIDDINVLMADDILALENFKGPERMLPEKPIGKIVEQFAKDNPDAIAIIEDQHQLSYGHLIQRVNRVAVALCLRIDKVSSQPVLICMTRTIDFAVAVLALWKLGRPYIPIDPTWPEQRVLDIISDSEASFLIHSASNEAASFSLSLSLVDIEALYEDPLNEAVMRLDHAMDLDTLAYIIYTSGSTGKPKGAMITQRGMLNHMMSKVETLQMGAATRLVQNANITFDISVWQFFAPLMSGGTTVIYSDSLILDPARFLQSLEKDRITIVEVVPSYLNILLNEEVINSLTLPALGVLMTTGENLPVTLVNAWFSLFPSIRMINAYGPTEASDDITHQILTGKISGDRVPLGTPIQNMKIYILSKNLQRCPVGVKGEICVAGAGVGKGYVNDRKKTEASFVSNPFGAGIYATLYKTGDVGRWLPDGTLEFFGRKDSQIKIRGYRIELGEIENTFLTIDDISLCAVKPFSGSGESLELAAFISVKKRSTATLDSIRSLLAKKLPHYMIPSQITILDELPLTENGKIDRESLVAVADIEYGAIDLVPAVTTLEKQLVVIWEGVLKRHPIGTNENFFTIGGHSLTAIQVTSMIFKILKVRIDITTFFQNPTIASLAYHLTTQQPEKFSKILPVSSTADYPLSAGQKRLWLLSQDDSRSISYNITSTFRLQGAIEEDALGMAWMHVLELHDSLRAVFFQKDTEVRQRILPNEKNNFGLTVKKLSKKLDSDVQELLNRSANAQFNLQSGPLSRATLLQLAEDDYVFQMTFHHIITDGWSFNLIVRDLLKAYKQLIKNQQPAVPSPRVNYRDYVVWIENLIASDAGKRQKEFWLNEFETLPPRLGLSKSMLYSSAAGNRVTYKLPDQVVKRIKNLQTKSQSTGFIIQAAITAILLQKLTGSTTIVLGIPTSGREHPDLVDVVGFFVNTLSLKVSVKGDDSFYDVIKTVSNSYAAAIAAQSYPFDLLISDLHLSGEENPLFEVMLVPDNIDIALHEQEYSGAQTELGMVLNVSDVTTERTNTQVDLSFHYFETSNLISGYIEYRKSAFDENAVQRIAEKLQLLIETLVEHENKPLWQIRLLSQSSQTTSMRPVNDLDF